MNVKHSNVKDHGQKYHLNNASYLRAYKEAYMSPWQIEQVTFRTRVQYVRIHLMSITVKDYNLNDLI